MFVLCPLSVNSVGGIFYYIICISKKSSIFYNFNLDNIFGICVICSV